MEKKAGTVYDRKIWNGFFFPFFKWLCAGFADFAVVFAAERAVFSGIASFCL